VSTVAAAGKGEAQNGPRSRKGVQTRARLLDAAKDIFREDGFLEARISDIAERAGLSHGAFYHYFDSKEQIFREIAETLDDRLSEPMENIIFAPGSSTSPRERLFGALHGHLESYQDEAQIMGVIEQVARYDEHVGAVRACSGGASPIDGSMQGSRPPRWVQWSSGSPRCGWPRARSTATWTMRPGPWRCCSQTPCS